MDQDQDAANALVAEANQALADGWTDRAIAAYRAAIGRFPAYASYHLVIGDLLAGEGRLVEAIDAYQATVEAGVSRVRPVILGAATTVLGVVPLLQDAFWISMAMTIMAGLTFGTVITMVLVPVLYATLHRIPSPKSGG